MAETLLGSTVSGSADTVALLDGMLVPMVVARPDSGRVLWANRQALSMLSSCDGILAEPARCTVRGLADSYPENGWHGVDPVWLCGEPLRAEVTTISWDGAAAFLLQLTESVGIKPTRLSQHYWGCSGVVIAKERYHAVYDSMAQGVLFQDNNGKIICANPAAQELLGLDNETMQNSRHCFKVCNAVDAQGAPMPLAKIPPVIALRTAMPVHKAVMGVQHPTLPQTRWLVVSSTPLFAEGTTVPREVFSTFEDITELINTRQKLEVSNTRLWQVIDNAPLGVFLWSYSNGRFALVHANPAAERHLDVEAQEHKGKRLIEVFPGLRSEELPRRLEQIMLTGIPAVTEQIEYSDDTVTGTFEVHAFKASDDLLCLMVQNITDRKRAEKEIERLAGLMHKLIGFMPSVLIGVDDDDRVTHWNQAAQELTGISSEGAVGKLFTQLYAWPAFLLEIVKNDCPSEGGMQVEDALWESGGIARNWSVTKYTLPQEEGGGYAIRMDDVTERVRMHNMMIQSEKMLSIAGLAAGMAHEINNPLGAISQAVQNVRRRMSATLPASRKLAGEIGLDLELMETFLEQRDVPSFLADIHKSCLRAGTIVSNMLAFSREESSQLALADINDIIRQSVILAESDYDPKKKYDIKRVQIQYKLSEDLPDVWCNVQDLQQVFLNLLRNSGQAMSGVTTAGYVPRLLLESRLLPNGMVEVVVRDNGPGMNAEVVKRCFEPFYTTKPVGHGTGLGLYVSYLLINQQRGSISVTNCKDGGAEFRIQLAAKDFCIK